MDRFARITVDIPLNRQGQVFDYLVPSKMEEKLKIGHAVKIPFGNRKVNGFVIGFSEESSIETSKIKKIIEIITDEPLFDQEMLDLFKWISAYYKSSLLKVIKTAIPTGLIEGRVSKKIIKYLTLAKPPREISDFIEKQKNRAPKQVKVLEFLLNNRGDYTVSQLVNVTRTTSGVIYRLLEKGFLEYKEEITDRRPELTSVKGYQTPFKPTKAQEEVIRVINNSIQSGKPGTFLLHGVTGSGKTEVYLQTIEYALNRGKGAIVLVPEISLTPVMVKRFYSRFGDQVAVLHSNLSLGERYDEWRRIKEGKARIAIGARSAIFAPVKNLGLMIIDEEHENTYKQAEYPYYHAREVALKRGKISSVPVILGSATPALESYYFARKGVFSYFSLPERINKEQLPPVKIIDMREELKSGNTTIFSNDLLEAIHYALSKEKQVMIFLNRRGYANFILCRECGYVIKCQNCDISLTYHASNRKLRCHYCDYSIELPETCPICNSQYIREFGIGTERIEKELSLFFPKARIVRMDVDTTARKGAHQRILEQVEKGEVDILVGTQMIAKGHDYPNISVVGVITADTILNIPDFRSGERTFQLLTQVAGRTGRGTGKGQVIIQTYSPEHYSIQAAKNHDYSGFYRQEIKMRENLNYPPFTQMVNIIFQGQKEDLVIQTAREVGIFLNEYHNYIDEKLGPSPAPISKLRNKYRWQIILKFKGWEKRNYILNELLNNRINTSEEVSIIIDVDPLTVL